MFSEASYGFTFLVDMASMSDSDNCHDKFVILDFIDDAVDALPHPVSFLGRQFLTSKGLWIFYQSFNTFENPFDVLIW